MKKHFLAILFILLSISVIAQSNRVINLFPEGTVIHGNIPYLNNTHEKHLLDIYLPKNTNGKIPLVVFIHGGGWLSNDKYADIGYMKSTVSEILESGYALVSIDYRFSTEAVFPAQMLDCNAAISFLVDNAEKYHLDMERMVIMGFSAGGHLASMVGLAKNNDVEAFYLPGSNRDFKPKGVVDFYGPADLTLFPGADNPNSPEGILIGAAPLDRPDLATNASPISFVDENDPPFLIIHGEKDDLVSPRHSHLLHSWLNVKGVPSELIIVKDAPHFGPMFDVEEIRMKVMGFLSQNLR